MVKVKKEKKKKVPLTKEQKKARSIFGLCIFGIVVLCITLVYFVVAIINSECAKAEINLANKFNKVIYDDNQLVPEKDTDGYYTFVTDEEFKVLQLTDIHIGGGFLSTKKDRWSMNAVASMITAEKPDLVVVTGDISFPVPYSAGTFNNLYGTEVFAELMESLGVYWTFTFGNHDTEVYSYFTREDLVKFYENKNYSHCLFERGDANISGYGNNIIKVKNTQGVVTQALVLLDSHSYTGGDALGILWKYDNLHKDQIDWYVSEIEKINNANKAIDVNVEKVKNSAFFHIPLREYRNAWKEYSENDYKDTENVGFVYGNMGEPNNKNSVGEMTYGVFCGIGDDDFFEKGQQNGLQAVFCGHDHYNNFSVNYKGIRLTYGMSIDYLAYAGIWQETNQRGCTVIKYVPNGSFECKAENYYQDKYVAQFEKQ